MSWWPSTPVESHMIVVQKDPLAAATAAAATVILKARVTQHNPAVDAPLVSRVVLPLALARTAARTAPHQGWYKRYAA